MSSQGSSSEDYALRRRREFFRDIDRGNFVGWAEEEKVQARRRDMDESVKEEVKEVSSAKRGQPSAEPKAGKATFVGLVNTQHAFSHNLQGSTPHVPDFGPYPAVTEALRVTDEFCDQYRVLRREVEILQEDNTRLRRMLERLLTPLWVGPPSPSNE